MGDYRFRLSAIFASLAIVAVAFGSGASPATAAPLAMSASELASSPTRQTSLAISAGTPTVFERGTGVSANGANTTTPAALYSELSFLPEDTTTSYDRALFEHWIDADGNGCDTRQEVLAAESQVAVSYGTGCTITAGQWNSWYDGAIWTNPADVDIDHLVPLQEAWQSGAWRWSSELRRTYANDLAYLHSLEAVTDEVNQSKGAQDPASWLPALEQCRYAVDWVSVKWRWNLTVDDSEQAALDSLVNDPSCGSTVIERPTKVDTTGSDTSISWPLYKIVYDATIYELVTNSDNTQSAVPLSFPKWRDVYDLQAPKSDSTDFVKYPWSPTVYAVTFWPGGENAWMWTPLSYPQWSTAGWPAPRNAGWIKGSYFYKWGTSAEILVEGADGVNHKLTYQDWVNSGFRSFVNRSDEGFVKLTWAPDFARMSSLSTGAGRPMGYAEWQEEAFPTPLARDRIVGDSFYKDCDSATVWYAGPGMNRPVSFAEWQAAGSPEPTVRNTPCGSTMPPPPSPPSNPGNSVNCTDFSTQAAAQTWFMKYYPSYGDVAALDRDGDGIACESN